MDIPKYLGIYQVSNVGRVRSLDRVIIRKNGGSRTIKGKLLTPSLHKKGYYYVRLGTKGNQKHFYIHRLVAIAFIPNPENNSQVNHINGIKTDNYVSNLEWLTPKENMEHAFSKGLGAFGERQWKAKLTLNQVKEIRKLLALGNLSLKEIGDMFDVSLKTISNIKSGKTWKVVT